MADYLFIIRLVVLAKLRNVSSLLKVYPETFASVFEYSSDILILTLNVFVHSYFQVVYITLCKEVLLN